VECEGEQWSRGVSAPLLSFVGTGPQFHTTADLTAEVTSPELLSTVYDSLASAIDPSS